MKLNILKGTTSKSVDIFIRDSSVTTGVGLTGLVYNTSGLTCYYHRAGSAAAAVTLATLASATAAYSSGGFIAVDGTNMPGVYRFDIPTAVLASGVDEVVVMLRGAANMEPVVMEIQLVSFNPNDTVRMGLTALPNVASGSTGAIITSGTGTAQLSVASGRANADVVYFGGAAGSFAAGLPAVNTTQFGGSAGTFASGRPEVNTTHFGGTAGTFASGRPQVNASHINSVAATSVTTINANLGTTQPVNFTGTAGSATVKSDVTNIATAAVSTTTAQVGANIVQVATDPVIASSNKTTNWGGTP